MWGPGVPLAHNSVVAPRMTQETVDQTFEYQEELESTALHWGAARFKRRCRAAVEEGDATRVGAARKLLLEALSRTEEELRKYLETRRPGRRHTAEKWVRKAGVEVSAYLACKVVLGSLGTRESVGDLAKSITDLLLDEIRCSRFMRLAPGLFNYRMQKFKTSSRVHMARSISATMNRALCQECREEEAEHCPHLDTSDLHLGAAEKLKIGTFLIRMLLEAFPGWLVPETTTMHTRPGSDLSQIRRETVLVPTEEAEEWIESRNEILSELIPVALPMVTPPAPWGPGRPGGYRYGLRGKYSFVRSTRKHQAMVEEAPVLQVYEAVNRIQETPWRINRRVWETMLAIEEGGGELVDFPSFEPVEPPRFPEDPEPEEIEAWKAEKTRSFAVERARQQEVRKWVNQKTVVNAVLQEPAIWFPHNLDFRGRVYPIPTFLHPQGDDRCRGLLEFADGKPLGGPRGVHWLAVHGANCLGTTPGGEKLSRMTLEDRAQWIADRSVRIRDTAAEPFSDLWWTDADEPWQFLAFCFSWAEMLQEGEDYVCYLPVSVDGTCNGLQHFAGMLRDVEGAQAVNVWPNETPEDVYERVAERVNDLLVEAAAVGEDYAERWLASGLVDRKLCKRPTMTFGYGSKPYGFTDQIIDYLRLDVEDWEGVESQYFTAEGNNGTYPVYKQASSYLAQLLWEALKEIVPGAFEAMEWLQEASRIIAKSGRPVRWTVPETDFPVIQDSKRYFKLDVKRVETQLAGGATYRPRVYEKKPKQPDRVKQANAVAPNVVHSLDAAALMKTVAMANHDGIEHFAMVHDSFGTHPSSMDALVEATRQAFFHLYSRHDVAEGLYHEFLNQVEDLSELEPPPNLGDLDLSVVLVSDYFFA